MSDTFVAHPEDVLLRTKRHLQSQRRFDASVLNFKTESDLDAVLLYLRSEWPKYSLDPLESLLTHLHATHNGVQTKVEPWLVSESSRMKRTRSAPSNVFTLLGLACALVPENQELLAQLFLLLCETTREKDSLRISGTKRVRRAIHFPIILTPSVDNVPLFGLVDPSRLSDQQKSQLVDIYVAHVIPSKSLPPQYLLSSLSPCLSSMPDSVLKEKIIPAFGKAMLRSPELVLPTVVSFLGATSSNATSNLITPILNSAKSSNPLIRSASISAFAALPLSVRENATQEILSLPKAGKTASVDHRACLYSILGTVPPSSLVAKEGLQLLTKESNENVQATLASSLHSHLAITLSDDAVITILSKELSSTKPATRKIFLRLVASAIWSSSALPELHKLIPPLELVLKNISTNPQVANLIEGYASLSILLKIGDSAVLDKNQNIAAIPATTTGKPHFLLNDKMVVKFITDNVDGCEGEEWLLRALEGSFKRFANEVNGNETLRNSFANAFVSLVTRSTWVTIRSATLETLSRLNIDFHGTITQMIQHGIMHHLSTPYPPPPKADSVEDKASRRSTGEQWKTLSALLLSATSLPANASSESKDHLLLNFLPLAHHPGLSPINAKTKRNLWIEMAQRISVDPLSIIQRHSEECLSKALETVDMGAPDNGFSAAAFAAIQTTLFVCPERILPLLLTKLKIDLSGEILDSISQQELDIWKWEPAAHDGRPFVDVLSASKKGDQALKKGKDAALAKWDAETRASLSKGASAAPRKLTPAEQQKVNAQLVAEDETRKRVDRLVNAALQDLHIISAIAKTCLDVEGGGQGIVGGEAIRDICDLLVGVLQSSVAVILGEKMVISVWLDLAALLTPRLEPSEKWYIAMAVLRASLSGNPVDVIPEEMTVEPLRNLVPRALYKLHFLSSTSPLDQYTFGFVWQLIRASLDGNISFPPTAPPSEGETTAEEEIDPEELPKLALDIVKFHSSDFNGLACPRIPLLKSLLHVLTTFNPNSETGKDASGVLQDLGVGVGELQDQEDVDSKGVEHDGGVNAFISKLLASTLVDEAFVRGVVLQTLEPFDLTSYSFVPELWIACQDDTNEKNQILAKKIWDENGLDMVPVQDAGTWIETMLGYLDHTAAYVRRCGAVAIAEGLKEGWREEDLVPMVIRLEVEYKEKAKILAPEFDQFGMVIASTLDRADPFPARIALGETFSHATPVFPVSHIPEFFQFLIADGPLGDRHPDVRKSMLIAATTIIDAWGKKTLSDLIPKFEAFLAAPQQGGESGDHVREAVVILIGRAARHLQPGDARLPAIVDKLVQALTTPAEQVQIAVSECLSPLAQSMPDKIPSVIEGLLKNLFDAPKYAERRGAAYGLAGIIKGIGISGMKQFRVLERLKAGFEDKKRYEPRQGTMFAFECLSFTLGRVFEPYVTHILPLLLSSFGDDVPDVREAGNDAAKVIMANMSGYGVKLILPTLLSGLEEKQWRSKKGSIELLGMMAYCSPRQLSLNLPVVIPRLTDVLTDSHTKVREAANRSLKMFGEVITNPEIQTLVPNLLKALADPTRTGKALGGLLKMSFMHYIDHSSLALILPIIERGLRERGAETKRKAAQIVGNLASLTDSKDFVPYLTNLLPMIHTVLVDPVPEARATAAKALGTLVERLGEHHFPNLVPSLLRTLKTDTSGVDRQGAAQGLSEVLAGLGLERLEGLLPDIIANAQSPRPTVREGFMSLLVYLPATFGTRFQPHIPKIITPVLSGLADSEEYVRDAAMRAGRMVVTNYSSRAIDLLLPELEQGMFDPGWRIRQSSITLVGELLFKISGISGKASDLEEEDVGVASAAGEASKRALVDVLGQERRDRILAALYLVRQDGVAFVRQAAIQIWKALVYNTPRTVRELLPELLSQALSLVSSSEFEQQETASRTITELCHKFGEKIVAQMIPILEDKSGSPDPRAREGVCLIICEIMTSTTETQREEHESAIINIVKNSLVDNEPAVRAAAAKAFDTLQEYIGNAAIDQTIPTLLEALRQPGQSSGTALQALKEVMSVRASTVFPVLIPTLTAIPITVFNAHALASLVTVAGNSLSRRLTSILNPLVKTFETEMDAELSDAVHEAIRAILASIDDPEGLNTLMLTLLGWAKNDLPQRRVSALQFFTLFCELSELDFSLYRVDWVRQVVSSMEDTQASVYSEALIAAEAFVKSVPKDELEPLVVTLRKSIESASPPGVFVPGFSQPKGIAPFVPIIIAGLTTGTHEQRENAADAIGELVERTEASAMKPFVVPFTGPLIRVATQATTLPPGVKTAILSSLYTMLKRIPQFVKPFFPQLQRTFVKSSGDPSSLAVRSKAAESLGALMEHQPRVDPVVTELLLGAHSQEDESIASSLVSALACVVKSAVANISEPVRTSCLELIEEAFNSTRGEPYYQSIAAVISGFHSFPELVKPVVRNYLVGGTPPSSLALQAILVELEDAQDEGRDPLFKVLGLLPDVAKKVMESLSSDRVNIAKPAREAREILRELSDPALSGII